MKGHAPNCECAMCRGRWVALDTVFAPDALVRARAAAADKHAAAAAIAPVEAALRDAATAYDRWVNSGDGSTFQEWQERPRARSASINNGRISLLPGDIIYL